MSVQAVQPIKEVKAKKSGGGLGGLLGGAVGAAAGMAAGGPGGAMAGFSAGSQLGSMVGNAASPGRQGSVTQQKGAEGGDADGPMTRRLKSGEAQEKMTQLRESALATAELPPEQRQQYLDPIMEAAGLLAQKGKV